MHGAIQGQAALVCAVAVQRPCSCRDCTRALMPAVCMEQVKGWLACARGPCATHRLVLAQANELHHEHVFISFQAINVLLKASVCTQLQARQSSDSSCELLLEGRHHGRWGNAACVRAPCRGRLPPVDVSQQIPPASDEMVVGKFPAVWINLPEALQSNWLFQFLTAQPWDRRTRRWTGRECCANKCLHSSSLDNTHTHKTDLETLVSVVMCLGSRSRANSGGFHTTKLRRAAGGWGEGGIQGFLACETDPQAWRHAAHINAPGIVTTPGHNAVCAGVVHELIPARGSRILGVSRGHTWEGVFPGFSKVEARIEHNLCCTWLLFRDWKAAGAGKIWAQASRVH
eukprot:1149653-Pelagomonas_calceolata.AAC.7